MRYFYLSLLILLVPAAAAANMANPYRPGDATGELGGDVGQLVVEHEDLLIDLRPFPKNGRAKIRATYTISNPTGSPVDVPLQFVAAGLESDVVDPTVTLDGNKLEYRSVEDAPVRGTWLVRPVVAWDSPPATQSEANGASLFFDATLPTGSSTIAVEYAVKPASDAGMPEGFGFNDGDHRFSRYTVSYVLEPARDWGDFGAIDLELKVPAGWEATTAPTRDSEGRIKKADEDLPAPVLLVQFRPETQWHNARSIVGGIGAVLVVLLLLFVGARTSRRLVGWISRQHPDEDRSLPYDVLEMMIAATFASLSVPVGAVVMALGGALDHLYPGQTYLFGFALIVACVGLGIIWTFPQALWILWRRKTRSAMP